VDLRRADGTAVDGATTDPAEGTVAGAPVPAHSIP